jgi:hypothetical protein
MKAELDKNGVMRIIPETGTEAYALKQWSNSAWVSCKDVKLSEDGHWRGSMLIADLTVSDS